MPTRKQIVDCSRTYLNTPFRHQGRIKGLGVDCAGFLLCVCQEMNVKGIPFEQYMNYDPYPTDDTVLRECRKNFKEIPVDTIQPGDILCMRSPTVPCHVGLVTDLRPGLGLIHAYSERAINKVCEHTLEITWRRRITAAFQFPGVTD